MLEKGFLSRRKEMQRPWGRQEGQWDWSWRITPGDGGRRVNRKPRGPAWGPLKATVRKAKEGSHLVHCCEEESFLLDEKQSVSLAHMEAAPGAALTVKRHQVAL